MHLELNSGADPDIRNIHTGEYQISLVGNSPLQTIFARSLFLYKKVYLADSISYFCKSVDPIAKCLVSSSKYSEQ